MNYDFLVVDHQGKNGRKDLQPYYKYLYNHNLMDEMEDKFVSVQTLKEKELAVSFGISDVVDNVDQSVFTLRKNDAVLMLEHDKKWNYTNAFGLNKDFIPTIEEIEMIKSSWLGNEDEIPKQIFNAKLFSEDFDFSYRKPKENLEIHDDEEKKECAIQKAAIMLFDFYKENDPNFIEKVKKNTFVQNRDAIDEIYERLSQEAVADYNHINELKNSQNSTQAEGILKLLDEYCVTRVDYVKRMQEINQKGLEQGINMVITTDEMIKLGIISNPKENPSLQAVCEALEQKYKKGMDEKIAKEKEHARDLVNQAQQEKEKQRAEDFELVKKLSPKTMQWKMKGIKQIIKGETIAVVSDDKESFRIGKMQNNKLAELNHDELKRLELYIEKLEIEKSMEMERTQPLVNADADNEHRMFWKAEKPDYKNDFKYEKTTPYALRGRIQFVCWKLEWVESGKKLRNARGIVVRDANGNEQDLPLMDKDGHIIYDAETGLPKKDGKWAKMPYNPNKPKFKAKSNDYKTWGSFEQACKSVRENGFDGIGIMLGNGLIGGDLDNAFQKNEDGSFKLDENGKKMLSPDKEDILKIANTYWEVSPSKTGVHFLSFGQLPENRGNRNDKTGLEFYGSGRFFTLTGDVMPGEFMKIQRKDEGTMNVKQIYDKYMPQKESKGVMVEVHWDDKPNELGLSNEQIKEKMITQGERRAMQKTVLDYGTKHLKRNPSYGVNIEKELWDGNWEGLYDNQSEADFAFLSKAKYYTTSAKQLDELMRESGLMRDKWDELRGFQTYGQRTIEGVFQKNQTMYNPKWNKKGEQNSQNSKKSVYKKGSLEL